MFATRRPARAGRALTFRKREAGATYDSAQTTNNNTRHWLNADSLSARAANSPGVRSTLRSRARYEAANNSYARGIVETIANDLIGRGPRLQVHLENEEDNQRIEDAWRLWSCAVRLPRKLRLAAKSKIVDGEAFLQVFNNKALPPTTRIQLDLLPLEADQVASPWNTHDTATHVDGIVFDEFGNPIRYDVLRDHPGDLFAIGSSETEQVSARSMLHWFRLDRPGQVRGVPELTPALELFAMLRRYTLATLTAAETAADMAIVLETEMAASSDDTPDPMETAEIERGMFVSLPGNTKAKQIAAEHPSTQYDSFVVRLLCEIARALGIPRNIALGDSSSFNFASGRLDMESWKSTIRVQRAELAEDHLDPLLSLWLDEAIRIPELLPAGVDITALPHVWHWDGFAHIDPVKEANAQKTRLGSLTSTLADEYAAQGKDWREALEQIAKERELMNKLGLTMEEAAPAAVQTVETERDE